jgi:hypothetical protein
MLKSMDEAIKNLEDRKKENVQIDGWDGVYASAQSIRKQFAKIIGEANLPDIPFESPRLKDSKDATESKKKPRRNKNDG